MWVRVSEREAGRHVLGDLSLKPQVVKSQDQVVTVRRKRKGPLQGGF